MSITPKMLSRNLSSSVILESIFITSHNLDWALFKKYYMSNTVLKLFTQCAWPGRKGVFGVGKVQQFSLFLNRNITPTALLLVKNCSNNVVYEIWVQSALRILGSGDFPNHCHKQINGCVESFYVPYFRPKKAKLSYREHSQEYEKNVRLKLTTFKRRDKP